MLCIICFPIFIHISANVIFKIIIWLLLNILTLRHKNGVYLYGSKTVEVLLKIQWIYVILLSPFVIGYFRGTWSEKGWELLYWKMHSWYGDKRRSRTKTGRYFF